MAVTLLWCCERCKEPTWSATFREHVDRSKCHAGPGPQPTLGERWDAERAEREAARASKAAAGGVDVVPVKL